MQDIDKDQIEEFHVQNEKENNSYCWEDPCFVGVTSFQNLASMEQMLSQPFVYEMLSAYLEKGTYITIPKITVWHRLNSRYLSSRAKNPPPSEGQGRFFMLRTNCLLPTTPREIFSKAACRVALLSVQKSHQDRNSKSDMNRKIQQSRLTKESRELFDDGDNQHKGSQSLNPVDEFCVSFEILRPKDADRADDIVEWASWTSKQAFIQYLKQPFVTQFSEIVQKCCYQPQEVLFWERKDDGLY